MYFSNSIINAVYILLDNIDMKINLDKNDMYSCVREIIHDWMPIFVRKNLCLFLNTRTKNSLNWNRMKLEIPNKNYPR